MGQQDRLGPLQVGVAGQVDVFGRAGPFEENPLEILGPIGDDQELPLGEQAQIRGHLVVPTSAGVEPGPDVAGDLGDPAFDGGMHVLVARLEDQGAARQLVGHPIQGGQQDLGLARGDEAGGGQPVHVGTRSGHVVAGQALVVGNARGVGQQLLCRIGVAEAPMPEGHQPRSVAARRLRPVQLAGGPGGHAEAPQPDETLGVLVAEAISGVVGGERVVVQPDLAPPAGHDAAAR